MVRTAEDWLKRLTGFTPHPWQARLAEDDVCADRLVRVPTGLGKTAGVVGAWTYHRVHRADDAWPRRLVFCFPMRVLVEQSARAIRQMLDSAGITEEVDVEVLMGGVRSDPERLPWHLRPDRNAILLGTQDMLLSRALNRGYAAPRARWPMTYSLLNADVLWVTDEVQLMGVGLATSAQLQAFRAGAPMIRPARTWWMSATLQPSWLATRDAAALVDDLRSKIVTVPPSERKGSAFDGTKPLTVVAVPAESDSSHAAWAEEVLQAHGDAEPGGRGRVTLAIANTVDGAVALHEQLLERCPDGTRLELVHSRFRGAERGAWQDDFLTRAVCEDPATNLVIVATQVVEAGVDISATALVTQLAPWPSLVQRFGRAARYGGTSKVVVVDRELDDKSAAPYDLPQLEAARAALGRLDDVAIATLERFEASLTENEPDALAALYPYSPAHVLRNTDYEELFDTGHDLTGMDLDVSRFIRDGTETDIQVYWRDVLSGTKPDDDQRLSTRNELCPVPLGKAKKWLAKLDKQAWYWDYLDETFKQATPGQVRPGMMILVAADAGGYDVRFGFTGAARGKKEAPVPVLPPPQLDRTAAAAARADFGQDAEDLSEAHGYKSIALHGSEAEEDALTLCERLGLDNTIARLIALSARLHDLGKVHPAFQSLIHERPDPDTADLAKAPAGAWRRPAKYTVEEDGKAVARPGFRHELASTLAVFEMLRRVAPRHEALLGAHESLIEAQILTPADDLETREPTTSLERELCELSADDFDLVAYLICAHHGKIRASWQATPQDQSAGLDADDLRGPPLRGVRSGDLLPSFRIQDGEEPIWTEAITLHLDPAQLGLSSRYGRSWRDRTERLLARHGAHSLAFFETLVRVADVRASMRTTNDPRWETPL